MWEAHETQQALTTVSQALAPLKTRMAVTWILGAAAPDGLTQRLFALRQGFRIGNLTLQCWQTGIVLRGFLKPCSKSARQHCKAPTTLVLPHLQPAQRLLHADRGGADQSPTCRCLVTVGTGHINPAWQWLIHGSCHRFAAVIPVGLECTKCPLICNNTSWCPRAASHLTNNLTMPSHLRLILRPAQPENERQRRSMGAGRIVARFRCSTMPRSAMIVVCLPASR